MELRQLRYLVMLAEERHFTRAARRVGIAQPALSQQISRLETEVGLMLVERTTRSVTLTAAGETLVAGARHALRVVEDTQSELEALRGVRAGRIVLGVTRTPGAVDVAATLADFHAAYPSVELDVREELSVDLLQMLAANELDVALIADGVPSPPATIEARIVASEPLVVIAAPTHRFADRSAVPFSDLDGERIVGFRRGATIRRQMDDRAALEGMQLRVAFETADAQRARALVAHGLAVGVLPTSDARAPGPAVAEVPLGGAPLLHRTAVAIRRDRHRTPAVEAFIGVLDGRHAGPGVPISPPGSRRRPAGSGRPADRPPPAGSGSPGRASRR